MKELICRMLGEMGYCSTDSKEYQDAYEAVCAAAAQLKKSMTPELLVLFENFLNMDATLNIISNDNHLYHGFLLGVQLGLEADSYARALQLL